MFTYQENKVGLSKWGGLTLLGPIGRPILDQYKSNAGNDGG